MRFFSWIAEVLADTADRQGSTKRVVMFIFLTNFMVLLTGVVVANGWVFPDIPKSILYLVGIILGGMGFLSTADKAIAVFDDFRNPKGDVCADIVDTK
jgi:uncharacterized ion transporter superfamily protein YfcC